MARRVRSWRFATPRASATAQLNLRARAATEQQNLRMEATSIQQVTDQNNARLIATRTSQLQGQQTDFMQQRENRRLREAKANAARFAEIQNNAQLASSATSAMQRLSTQVALPGQPSTFDRLLRTNAAAEYQLPSEQRVDNQAYLQTILATPPTDLSRYQQQVGEGEEPKWSEIPLLGAFFQNDNTGQESIFDAPVLGGLLRVGGAVPQAIGSTLAATGEFFDRTPALNEIKQYTAEPLLKGAMDFMLAYQEAVVEPIVGLLSAPDERGDYRSFQFFSANAGDWVGDLLNGTGEYSGLYQDEVDNGPLGSLWHNFRAAWTHAGEQWRESNEPYPGYKGFMEILFDPTTWLWGPATGLLKQPVKGGFKGLVKYVDEADASLLNAPMRAAVKGTDAFASAFSGEYRWWRVGAPRMHEFLRAHQAEMRAIPGQTLREVERAIGTSRITGHITDARGINEMMDFQLSDLVRTESKLGELYGVYPEMMPRDILSDKHLLEQLTFDDLLIPEEMRAILKWYRDEWRPAIEAEKVAAGLSPEFFIDDYLHNFYVKDLDDAFVKYGATGPITEGKLSSAYRRTGGPDEGLIPSFMYSITRDAVETKLFRTQKDFIRKVVDEWGIHPETLQPIKGGKRFAGREEFLKEMKRLQNEVGDIMPQVADANADILMARNQIIRAGIEAPVADEFIQKVLVPTARAAVALDPQRFPTIGDYTRNLPIYARGRPEIAAALEGRADAFFEQMNRVGTPGRAAEAIAGTPTLEIGAKLRPEAGRTLEDLVEIIVKDGAGEQGKWAKTWYEDLGSEIAAMFPDPATQSLFIKIVAITSARTPLKQNLQRSLVTMYNIMRGEALQTRVVVPGWKTPTWTGKAGPVPGGLGVPDSATANQVLKAVSEIFPEKLDEIWEKTRTQSMAAGKGPAAPVEYGRLQRPYTQAGDRFGIKTSGGTYTDEIGAVSGAKTVNFEMNIRGIPEDPVLGLSPVTIDRWMARLMGYTETAPSNYHAYLDMQKRVSAVADATGMQPWQTQAMLWVHAIELFGNKSESIAAGADELLGTLTRTGPIADDLLGEVTKHVNGAIDFSLSAENRRPMVYLFETADFRTLVHEQGHFLRRWLPDKHYKAIEEIYSEAGKWTRTAEERFANDFADFVVSSRVANHPKFGWGIRDGFNYVKWIMNGIYNRMVGSGLPNSNPSPARHIFDEWFSYAGPVPDAAKATRQWNPQVVIAPSEAAQDVGNFQMGVRESLKGEFQQAVDAHAGTVGGPDNILGIQVNRGAWYDTSTKKVEMEYSTVIDLAPDVPMEQVYDFADQLGRSQKQYETWVLAPESEAARAGHHAETWFEIDLGQQVRSPYAKAILDVVQLAGGGGTVTADGRLLLMNMRPYAVTPQGTLAYNQASTWLKQSLDEINGVLRAEGYDPTVVQRRGHIRRLDTSGGDAGRGVPDAGGRYPSGNATPLSGDEAFEVPARGAGGAGIEAEISEGLRGARQAGDGAAVAAADAGAAGGAAATGGRTLSDLPRRRPRVPGQDDIERYQSLRGSYSGTPEQIWDQRVAANDLPELPLTYGKQLRPPPGYSVYHPKGPLGYYPIKGTELVEAEARKLAGSKGVVSATLEPGAEGIETAVQQVQKGYGVTKNVETYWLPEEIKKGLEMTGDPLKHFRLIRGYDQTAGMMKLMFTRFFTDYHARNFWSGYHNMVLDGVWNPMYIFKAGHVLLSYMFPEAKWAAKTIDGVGVDDYLHGLRRDGVLGTGQVSGEIDELLGGISNELGMPKAREGKFGRALEFSKTAAEFIENVPRVAHDLGLRAQKVPAKEAARRVRRLQVDYTDLTTFEKAGPRRVAFYYTYARKMGPVMAHEMMKTRKLAGLNMGPTAMVYSRTARGLQNLFDPDHEDTKKEVGLANAWLNDRFSFAMGRTPDGNPKMLYATGLPIELINNFWMGNSGRTFDMWKSQVHPLLKAPFEAPVSALWDPDTPGKTVSPNYSSFTHRTIDDPSYQNWFRRGAPFISKIPGLRDWLQMEETEIPVMDPETGEPTEEMRSIYNVNPHRMYLFMSAIGRFVNTAQEGIETIQGIAGDPSAQQRQKALPERILQLISGAKFTTIDLQRRQTLGFGIEHTAAYEEYGESYSTMADWWQAGQMPDGLPYTGAQMMEARDEIKDVLSEGLAVADNNLVKAGHLGEEEVREREFLRISLLSNEDRKLALIDAMNPDEYRLGDGSIDWDRYWGEYEDRYEDLSLEQQTLLEARKEESIMRLPEGNAREMERMIQEAFEVSRVIASIPKYLSGPGGQTVEPEMQARMDDADRFIRGISSGLGPGSTDLARRIYITNAQYPGTKEEKMEALMLLMRLPRNPQRLQMRRQYAELLKAVFGDVPMDVFDDPRLQQRLGVFQNQPPPVTTQVPGL